MSYIISSGIVDFDVKGTTGRGTIFWLEIVSGLVVIERHEYGLLEELNGSFDRNTIVKKYVEENRRLLKDAADQEATEKKLAKESRVASVKEDPVLIKFIQETIANETKAIAEFQNGKEKALNSIVGKIIGLCKKENIEVDAFKINTLLKQQLKGST